MRNFYKAIIFEIKWLLIPASLFFVLYVSDYMLGKNYYHNLFLFAIFLFILLKNYSYLMEILENIASSIEIKKYNYRDFLQTVLFKIFTINISFALDYFCLNIIEEKVFHGLTENTSSIITFFELFYFSTVTFATVGYGDIYAINIWARLLVTVEIFTAFSLIVLLISNFELLKGSFKQNSFFAINNQNKKDDSKEQNM